MDLVQDFHIDSLPLSRKNITRIKIVRNHHADGNLEELGH